MATGTAASTNGAETVATAVTSAGGAMSAGASEVYAEPEHLEISSALGVGSHQELKLSFEAPDGTSLGSLEGTLQVKVFSDSCLYCETTSFSNLPQDQ